MGLFSARELKTPPAAPAPTRARNSVSSAELKGAIGAVCDAMAPCTARATVQALYILVDDTDDIVKLNGSAPVTLLQLDDALAETKKLELPTGTLAPLKRVRELLARAE